MTCDPVPPPVGTETLGQHQGAQVWMRHNRFSVNSGSLKQDLVMGKPINRDNEWLDPQEYVTESFEPDHQK